LAPNRIFIFSVTGVPRLGPSIDSVAFDGKKTLTISGSQFGSAPQVAINGQDRTDFLASSTDTSITLKGKAKRLGLRSGDNTLQVTDSTGAASNLFTFTL
jgi:hypothetical protein